MEEITSREKVLKEVRNALLASPSIPMDDIDLESSVYQELYDQPEFVFAQELTNVAGKFLYCENKTDFGALLKALMQENNWNSVFTFDPVLQQLLESLGVRFTHTEEEFKDVKVGITFCEYLIARLGSIMVSSKQGSGRRQIVFPEVHIVVAYTSQLVPDLKVALKKIKEKYAPDLPSLISVITGPSRTADIEKTLVMGAHGPRELFVFLIEDQT